MHPAFLYLPGSRLSLSELSAARLDGDVVELGEAYIPADLVEGPALRAGAVATLIPTDTAASGPTAAWIHGAGSAPPVQHHVRRVSERRLRVAVDLRVVFHDGRVAASDICMLGDVAVTTPERTMCDLLLGAARAPELSAWVRMLADVQPSTIDFAEQEIVSLRRVPGRTQALAALDELRLRTR